VCVVSSDERMSVFRSLEQWVQSPDGSAFSNMLSDEQKQRAQVIAELYRAMIHMDANLSDHGCCAAWQEHMNTHWHCFLLVCYILRIKPYEDLSIHMTLDQIYFWEQLDRILKGKRIWFYVFELIQKIDPRSIQNDEQQHFEELSTVILENLQKITKVNNQQDFIQLLSCLEYVHFLPKYYTFAIHDKVQQLIRDSTMKKQTMQKMDTGYVNVIFDDKETNQNIATYIKQTREGTKKMSIVQICKHCGPSKRCFIVQQAIAHYIWIRPWFR